MKVAFKKSFLNNIKKITDKTVKLRIEQAILSAEKAESKKDIVGLKKLKASKKNIFYRIKIGDHRIGITIEDNVITFTVCMPRKDIYRFFP